MGPPEGPTANARVLTDLSSVAEVEDEWRLLAERQGNTFVTPEWFHAWFRHYGEGAEPAVIVLRDPAGSLSGLLPLVRSGRTLRFAGANVADRLHPVAEGCEGETLVAAAAGPLLEAVGGRWSSLVLDNVERDAGWWPRLVDAAPKRLAATAYRDVSLPYIELPASWDEYLASRSRNMRSQLGRKLRALEREHEVRFRKTEEAGEVSADLETFFRLHDARWEGRGGSSSQGGPVRAFHADFCVAALQRGWLRLWVMEVDGEPAAAWYGWRLGGRYSYYLAGFDPRWTKASVGLLMLAHTVRAAIEEGAAEYDLLLGEESYKDRFATARREVQTVLVTPAAHPARLLAAAETGAWRMSRRLSPDARRRIREGLRPVLRLMPGRRSR